VANFIKVPAFNKPGAIFFQALTAEKYFK